MFVVNGAMYAISAPLWGYICDKKLSPIYVTTVGTVLIIISFVFIGPAPFIPMDTILGVSIASLVVHGVGFAAELVAGFSAAHREALAHGFADNLNTYALVSGLWTATFALGAFIGPSVAGLIVDFYGFRPSTLFVLISQLTVFLLCLLFIVHKKRTLNKNEGNDETTPLLINAITDEDVGYDSFSNESEPVNPSEISDEIQAQPPRRSLRRARRTRLNVPNAGRRRHHSYSAVEVFSPSPLEPSPVSLLGGYMGISVPSTMTRIEEIDGPILPKTNDDFANESVTAIIEDYTSPTRPHASGSIC